jgi:hypothetical protein
LRDILRAIMLGRNEPKQTVGPIPLDTNFNTTKTLTTVTNTNPISWADAVRRNPKHDHSVQEPIRDRFLDTIGRYATRLNIL